MRQRTSRKNSIKTASSEGLETGWTRTTFILQEEIVDKLKDIAYWNRETIKDTLNEALLYYMENHPKAVKTLGILNKLNLKEKEDK